MLQCLTILTVRQFYFFCSRVISCISVCTHSCLVTNLHKLLTCSEASADTTFFLFHVLIKKKKISTQTPKLLFDCWVC